MSGDSCRIEELVLRIPGIAPGDAHGLADAVAHRLAERLRGSHRVAAIREVRIDVPAGLGRDQLADAIAEQIARATR
jgi:hypothetical protein